MQSASLKLPEVQEWLHQSEPMESLANAILSIVHPDLHQVGFEANQAYEASTELDKPCDWPSVYSGIDIIVNRLTPPHRDAGSAASSYDLLISLGEGHADLHLTDLGAQLKYWPGTLVFLTGRVLEHAVPEWKGGERVAVAHYMKDLLHDRMHVPCPALPTQLLWWFKFGSGW